MTRRKTYEMATSRQAAPIGGSSSDSRRRASHLMFAEVLGEPPRGRRFVGVELGHWTGRGVDEWVWATIETLAHLLRSGTRSAASIKHYGLAMAKFFEFLADGRPCVLIDKPIGLTPLHVVQFITWLRRRQESQGFSPETTRSVYKRVKAVLTAMMDIGAIQADPRLFFPAGALPHGNALPPSAQPYSDAEQQRIAGALKADLVDVHHSRVRLNGSEVMTIYFLIVAMRTGANATPLLEMERDDLKPGLLPGTRILRLRKHRGGKIITRLAGPALTVLDDPTKIPVDAVAVLEKALAETAHLATQAQESLRNRVWLYRSMSRSESGAIKCLNDRTIGLNARRCAERRQLLDDAGQPLVISTKRLRQSLSKRAWRLSEGDPLAVATVLGNTSRVADHYYLRMDEQLQTEAAQYLVQEMSLRLRGETDRRVVTSTDGCTPTPVARCKDSLHGAHAPKNGSHHCDQFVLCLTCPSFAIVGDSDDLWRLYSFQGFARQELGRLEATPSATSGEPLRDLYQAAIPFIDRFCMQAFGEERAAAARDRATLDAHPFWKLQSARSAHRRDGQQAGSESRSDPA